MLSTILANSGEVDMQSASNAPWYARPWHATALRRRRYSAGVGELVCPLVFSLAGLLANGLALMLPGEDGWPALPGFALIAAAPAIAAMAAVHFAGQASEPYR
jgi:hypothetical protein